MRRVLIGIGLCVALAAPAAASGTLKTFSGKVDGGGKIGIEADVVQGHAVEIKQLVYKNVRVHCDNANGTVSASFNFTSFFVNANNRFEFNDDYTAPGVTDAHLLFKGTFKRHARRVEGALKDRYHSGSLNQDCNTGKRGYRASRGPLPQLKSTKAVRLSP